MFRCQSSEQYTGFGGAWITKDRFISSLKRKFLITTDDTLHISPASVASIFNSWLAVGVVSYFEETYQTISPLLQIISSCMSVCVTHVRMCSCTHVSIYVGGGVYQTQASFINYGPPHFGRQYFSLSLGLSY